MPLTTRFARRETMQITGAPVARRRSALIAQLGETVMIWQTERPESAAPDVIVDLVNAIRSLDQRGGSGAGLGAPLVLPGALIDISATTA